jgi:hypothetical protein
MATVFTIPGNQAALAFLCCRDTPVIDHDIDTHIEVMQMLRDHVEAQEGKDAEDFDDWTGELKGRHIRYMKQCRDAVGQKGFGSPFVKDARDLKETLADMIAHNEASKNPVPAEQPED